MMPTISTKASKLKEYEIVNYLIDYGRYRPLMAADEYLKNKNLIAEDIPILKKVLESYAELIQQCDPDSPYQSYEIFQKNDAWMEPFPFFLTFICVFFFPEFFFLLLASWGLVKDSIEICDELIHRQRRIANSATIVLTMACFAGLVIGMMALFSVAPLSLIPLAIAVFTIVLALTLKLGRMLFNTMDAAASKDSGLKWDSRFKLTPKEIENLKAKNFSDESIERIEVAIRFIASQVKDKSKIAFFGSKNAYLFAVGEMTDLKTGKISSGLADKYGIVLPKKPRELLNPEQTAAAPCAG